jgi:glycosyltransferase involved in cell wall biosynthesis
MSSVRVRSSHQIDVLHGRVPGTERDSGGAVGVVLPVCNEEQALPSCLAALEEAASTLRGARVEVVAVLDACHDDSETILARCQRRWSGRTDIGLHLLSISARNVGAARAHGCNYLLQRARPGEVHELWLAFTDSDSEVPPHWLRRQLEGRASGWDAWVGTVRILDRGEHDQSYLADLQADYDAATTSSAHSHVHGTNLGVKAAAYIAVGGFRPLRTGEDHDLVNRLRAARFRIERAVDAPVMTSGRLQARAPAGFAGYLEAFKQDGPSPLSA